MTDEQIIKALECCEIMVEKGCAKCPYHKVLLCAGPMSRDTLDLINRQKAEIEQKDVQIGKLCDKLTSYKAEAERSNRDMQLISLEYNFAKAEAIKEFAERLKEKAERYDDEEFYVNDEDIDNLVQEMVGETDV